jgi:flagellar hook-associated protein 1 FlgK
MINQMATQIAALNQQIASVSAQGEQPNDLEDSRDQLVTQLSQLVPATVTNYNNGTADVSIFGQTLSTSLGVANTVSLSAAADSQSYSGYDNELNIYNGSTTVTVNLTSPPTSYAASGGLAGMELARQKAGDYLGQLDTLAVSLATTVNYWHENGYTYNGTTGVAFFTTLSTSLGAAANISLSASIAGPGGAEPILDNIAAAATNTDPRDGTNAVTIAALQSSTIPALNNSTFDAYYQSTVEQVGADVQNAGQMQSTAQSTNNQLVNMQQSVSGVSTDAEMTKLVQYQYAYQAAAQFLSVQNKLLDTLINGTLQ